MPRRALAAALLTLTALAGLPQAAQAGCTPGVGSDSSGNTCIGAGALTGNTLGGANSATGYSALSSNTTGFSNSATGYYALSSNTTGEGNSATGSFALSYNTTGYNNSATGYGAMYSNTTGSFNSATGILALNSNTTGSYNSATGVNALSYNTTGSSNTGTGNKAGGKQTGSNNTWLGAEAGWSGDFGDGIFITGSNNTALGYQAGSQWTTGSNNIALGHAGVAGDDKTIRIGGTTQTRTFVTGIFATKAAKGSRPVLVDANGQLATSKSSLRYKEDVHSMGDASNALMGLRPVTYRYKQAEADGSKPIQDGLIAEEVDKVMPAL
ncbi:tail fiber domain-containing protein, partial [Aestuariivirga sp.]|uniref:tail fiber domain-containing protein n=1 Tax=Aestuariivirga sp. TaxID=2650926 RepID=UPI0025C67DF2